VRVFGEVRAAHLPPGPAELLTMPGAAGGVLLATDIGGGRRALTLNRANATRLVRLLEETLDDWPELRRSAPFTRTLMLTGATSDRVNPFLLQIGKSAGAPEPVFLLGVAYTESQAFLALDRDNAARWVRSLRAVLSNPA
jgi:hypothetical protein